MARVLAIDPDRKQPELVARFARDAGAHDVVSVSSWDEARAAIDVQAPDLILVAAQPQWIYWFKPTGSSDIDAAAAARAFVEETRIRVVPVPPRPSPIARVRALVTAAREPAFDLLREWTPALLKMAAAGIVVAALAAGGVQAARWWNARASSAVLASTAPTQSSPRTGAPAKRNTVKARATANLPVSAAEAALPGWLALFSPVELTVMEGGREVRFDESSQVMLPPGRHQLTLVNAALGYREIRTVNLKPGVVTPVSIVLPKTTLTITAVPSAVVSVDGISLGQTPLTDVALDLGTREIVLSNATYGQRRFTITATVKPVRLDVDLTKPTP